MPKLNSRCFGVTVLQISQQAAERRYGNKSSLNSNHDKALYERQMASWRALAL